MKDSCILGHDESTADGSNCCYWLLAQPLGGNVPGFLEDTNEG